MTGYHGSSLPQKGGRGNVLAPTTPTIRGKVPLLLPEECLERALVGDRRPRRSEGWAERGRRRISPLSGVTPTTQGSVPPESPLLSDEQPGVRGVEKGLYEAGE